jgi:hypothetical protein
VWTFDPLRLLLRFLDYNRILSKTLPALDYFYVALVYGGLLQFTRSPQRNGMRFLQMAWYFECQDFFAANPASSFLV